MNFNLSITDAIRGADALFTAWQTANPKDRRSAQLAGLALLVCHFPNRIPEILAIGDALEKVIDAALSDRPSARPVIDGEELHEALDTDDHMLVEVVSMLCGLVRQGDYFSGTDCTNSVVDVGLDALFDSPKVVPLAKRR